MSDVIEVTSSVDGDGNITYDITDKAGASLGSAYNALLDIRFTPNALPTITVVSEEGRGDFQVSTGFNLNLRNPLTNDIVTTNLSNYTIYPNNFRLEGFHVATTDFAPQISQVQAKAIRIITSPGVTFVDKGGGGAATLPGTESREIQVFSERITTKYNQYSPASGGILEFALFLSDSSTGVQSQSPGSAINYLLSSGSYNELVLQVSISINK